MHLPVLMLLLFAGTACNSKKESKTPAGSVSVVVPTTDTSRYAVILFNEKQTYLFKNARPASLSAAEIESIELLLAGAVAEYNKTVKGKDFEIKPLEKYRMQLVPVINEKGEKEVWVTCFCSGNPQFKNWRTELVGVDDGGSCFFNIKINLSAKKTYDLMVNGMA